MSAKALDFNAAEAAFGVKLIPNGIGTQALHDTVVGYRANRRQGTVGTLTKATVKASGSKPYKQKGTGNARAGYISSPIRRGGGVAFGPQPRDYSKKLPKKVRRLALRKALSESAKNGKLFTASSLKLESPKTKELAAWIKKNQLEGSLLIVTKDIQSSLLLSGRNIPGLEIMQAAEVNAENILRPKRVVLIEEALPVLSERIK
ncbi:MAG: 50S ribosomal protein L4 [Candidatus Methylacidiphilales bacterium]